MTEELFLTVHWTTEGAPGLQWKLAPAPWSASCRGPRDSSLCSLCQAADQARKRGDVAEAISGYDRVLHAYDALQEPSAADQFMWSCAAWSKGATMWNQAVGQGTFEHAPLPERQQAWRELERAMAGPASALPKPISFVLMWTELAMTVAPRCEQWLHHAALGQFAMELGSKLQADPAVRKRLIDLFLDNLAALYHVLVDKLGDPTRAVSVARDLQSRCERDGTPLLPVRQIVFEALMAAGQFDEATHEAREVVQWAVRRGDDEVAAPWKECVMRAGVAAGEPYYLAMAGHEPPADMPVDRVVGVAGRTALMAAVEKGNLPLVRRLVERGADPGFCARGGVTPCMLAAVNAQPAIMRFLIEAGADPNVRSRHGDAALHLAIENAETVRVLLEGGADAGLENADGVVALELARQAEAVDTLRLLAPHAGAARKKFTPADEAIGMVRLTAGNVPSIQYVRQPFYDGNREADVRLICGQQPQPVIEVEDLDTLRSINREGDLGRFNTTILQWRPIREIDGRRGMYWFDRAAARAVGEAIKGGITRRLMLMVTMFEPGALTLLADTVGAGQLSTLGLLWYFSGDDITDRPAVVDEIGHVCRTLGVEQLTVLTGAYSDAVDVKLAQQVKIAGLRSCAVFLKDRSDSYPLISTPAVTATLVPQNG
jgi:hypothetical protein